MLIQNNHLKIIAMPLTDGSTVGLVVPAYVFKTAKRYLHFLNSLNDIAQCLNSALELILGTRRVFLGENHRPFLATPCRLEVYAHAS